LVEPVECLPPDLIERVLDRLGFSIPPAPTMQGARALYAAWCQKVPFDNVRKLISLQGPSNAALPGDAPSEYLEAWLRYGTGGTCWAGNGALHAVLSALGMPACRVVATMLVYPFARPNHGSVCVAFEGRRYLLDASMLHGEPLELIASGSGAIEHPAWGVKVQQEQGRWNVRWRPLHMDAGMPCRIEEFDVTAAAFAELHEKTRRWSPFNYQLYARINRGERVIGIALGRRVEIDAAGTMRDSELTSHERQQFLIEELGIAHELVYALPADTPTPPPP
jgi:arylamine N-acetyltransferase